ncbi:2954_t:CDS:2, partial [Diversispora eburnea]
LTLALALWNDLESQIDETFEHIDDGSGGRLTKLTDEEVTKKINKIVDEKLLILEKTIKKHYLSGFKLYDSDLKKSKKNENIFEWEITDTDRVTLIPDSYISKADTYELTTGDWTLMTGIWPLALVDGNQSKVDNGLIFGLLDDEYLYFTVNKQHYDPMTFENALWIILFGRGKYKSWGLVQRYFLRNSPDVHKKDDTDRLLNMPYLEPNSATSIFYFNTIGTPTFYGNCGVIGIGKFNEHTDKEITKKINKIVDKKLWFLEQIMSRHYISGFR